MESTNGSCKEVMVHVLHPNAQISAMAKLTSNMEVQYSAAQDVIKALQSKVLDLEKMVKSSKEDRSGADVVVAVSLPPPVVSSSTSSTSKVDSIKDGEEEADKKLLTEFLAGWKKTVKGQWSDVKEEWREECERLKRARGETKMKSVDTGLEKINRIHNVHHGSCEICRCTEAGAFEDPGESPESVSAGAGVLRKVMGVPRV